MDITFKGLNRHSTVRQGLEISFSFSQLFFVVRSLSVFCGIGSVQQPQFDSLFVSPLGLCSFALSLSAPSAFPRVGGITTDLSDSRLRAALAI
jgi:hypothetical protein